MNKTLPIKHFCARVPSQANKPEGERVPEV